MLAEIADPNRLAEIGEWLVCCDTGDEFLARVASAPTRGPERHPEGRRPGCNGSTGQAARVVRQMVGDERLDEVVAVVVARMAAEIEPLVGLPARRFEQVGMKLRLQELVVLALVDEDRPAPRTGADEGGGVVRGPGRPIVSEVAAERLLAPRALRGGANRSERGDRRYAPGFLSAMVKAPWPPIEWPNTPVASSLTGNRDATRARSSLVT